MGLIGNGSRLNTGCGFKFGSPASFSIGNSRQHGEMMNFRMQSGATTTLNTSMPNGMYAPNVYYPPIKAGDMSMRAEASGAMTGNLFPAKGMVVNLTGEGTLSASSGLVVSMIAALTGFGDFSAGASGRLNMTANLVGTSSFASAMNAQGNMVANLMGQGDLSALISAYGNMEVEITVTGTGLSTANVGQAVWSAIASQNDVAGTMGEKLNDAGGASNPWNEVIESGFTAGEILRLLAAVAAGDGESLNGLTTKFKSLDGTKDRVIATVSGGNRDVTTLDVT